MSNEAVWARRVEEWESSGLTSTAFCEGRDFTAGGLRHWAYRLRRNPGEAAGAKRARSKAGIELARVVRTPERAVSARGSSHTGETPVVVELGLVRVAVTRGFDDDTLAAVLRLVARLSTGAAS